MTFCSIYRENTAWYLLASIVNMYRCLSCHEVFGFVKHHNTVSLDLEFKLIDNIWRLEHSTVNTETPQALHLKPNYFNVMTYFLTNHQQIMMTSFQNVFLYSPIIVFFFFVAVRTVIFVPKHRGMKWRRVVIFTRIVLGGSVAVMAAPAGNRTQVVQRILLTDPSWILT